jgi:hypothetical protein
MRSRPAKPNIADRHRARRRPIFTSSIASSTTVSICSAVHPA